MSYARYGANSGMSACARHRKGLYGFCHERLLYSAFRSTRAPENSASQSQFGHPNSFDSIIKEEQRFSMEDFIFEKTDQPVLISDWRFSNNYLHSYRSGLLPPHQFLPLSVLSIGQANDDDTMISVSLSKPYSMYLTEFVLDARGWSCSAPFSRLHY